MSPILRLWLSIGRALDSSQGFRPKGADVHGSSGLGLCQADVVANWESCRRSSWEPEANRE